MLGLKLNHVSKRGPWCHLATMATGRSSCSLNSSFFWWFISWIFPLVGTLIKNLHIPLKFGIPISENWEHPKFKAWQISVWKKNPKLWPRNFKTWPELSVGYIHTWWIHQTSIISCTLVGNKLVDHSDVVGASPVSASPTTSSFSTQHLASIEWAKTTARQDTFKFWDLVCPTLEVLL